MRLFSRSPNRHAAATRMEIPHDVGEESMLSFLLRILPDTLVTASPFYGFEYSPPTYSQPVQAIPRPAIQLNSAAFSLEDHIPPGVGSRQIGSQPAPAYSIRRKAVGAVSRSDEDLAWDMAIEYSLSDNLSHLRVEDVNKLHPVLQEQLEVAIKRRMPSPMNQTELSPYVAIDRRNTTKASKEKVENRLSGLLPRRLTQEPSPAVEDSFCCQNARHSLSRNYFCYPCSTIFCDPCWTQQIAHRPTQRQIGGVLHEKTNPVVAKKIGATLEADLTDNDHAMLHVQDEDTTWFGAGRDENGTVIFQDFGRYANLMAERSSRNRVLKYPALVSFVGQTGAGKSTLIKLLVELCASDRMGQV